MDSQWIVALAPVAGLAIDVFGQIVAVHGLRLRLSSAIPVGMLAGAAATALILFEWDTFPAGAAGRADIWAVGSLTYVALAYGFWTFLNLNITSLRIRVLRSMLRAGGAMPADDVLAQYGPGERLARRLERLRNGKQIVLDDGRWRVGSWQVLTIARCIEFMRFIVMPRHARK